MNRARCGMLCLLALSCACGSKPADGGSAGAVATGGIGAAGADRAGRGAGSGAGSRGAGSGTGGAGEGMQAEPVEGDEPVDDEFGTGLRGCRVDEQCEAMPLCPTCAPQWACVAPGGTRPGGCGTACCTNPAQCIPPGQMVVPPGPGCTDDSGCFRAEAAHCLAGACVQCLESAHCLDPFEPLCSANACVQCAGDADCKSPSSPLCIGGSCLQCVESAQCPSDKPFCIANVCRQCTQSSDCALGVCVGNACQPECSTDEQCSGPAKPLQCATSQRCEPIACSADAECPPAFVCAAGRCGLAPCAGDADCHAGAPYCVQGFCYPTLGTCHSRFSA